MVAFRFFDLDNGSDWAYNKYTVGNFRSNGVKNQKTVFSWAGISIVILEILAILTIVGIVTAINLPATIARNQEISQAREEIINYETYADLTPFGLGVYKLRCEGDKHLWDVTKPSKTVIFYDGAEMVFDVCYNRKDEASWDNWWGNSNKGQDVTYDVIFYEDTYIIIPPVWDQRGTLYYWGIIYLCKDLNENADLFDIGISDKKVFDKLRELPGEKYSRLELSEKLGKEY